MAKYRACFKQYRDIIVEAESSRAEAWDKAENRRQPNETLVLLERIEEKENSKMTKNEVSSIRNMKREISGFGGGYEKTCRKMLIAGLRWIEEHPDINPKFSGYKDVYGIINEDNKDAEQLSEAVVDGAPNRDCTGAMHQAVVSAVLYVKKNGLQKYLEIMNLLPNIKSTEK